VRPNDSGYVIVDGEHGWRAAKELGLAELPCEVVDVDDFEAMRQTYKRNRHGSDDPLQLGRMFKRMLDARGQSHRGLANEIEVSEGTIRNGLMYAEAAELRNSYVREGGGLARAELRKANEDAHTPDEQIARLSVRQVRAYLHLPPTIANLWLDAGADLRELYRAKSGDEMDELEANHPQSCGFRKF
jgi:ParB-like chromosome segregation protein Spo0J